MSEFSAILEVVTTVVTFVFEATLDIVCCAFAAVSLLAVWNIPDNVNELSQNQSRNSWRSTCAELFFRSIVDFIIIPFTAFIALSPLRWSHVSMMNNDNDWELREQIMTAAFGGAMDLVAYFMGLFMLLSPFGRVVTVCRSTAYLYRAELRRDFEDNSHSTNRFSKSIIKHGLATILDWLVLILLLPLLLLTPSVWSTTYRGIALLLNSVNQPTDVPSSRNYSSEWMDWYATLRTHLFNQIGHCLVDLLHGPSFLLVVLSPLRQPALWRKIQAEAARFAREDERYLNRKRSNIDDYEFQYSVDVRWECLELSVLALADLLLFPMLLPLWATQYRYKGLRSRLWPQHAARASMATTTTAAAAVPVPAPPVQVSSPVLTFEPDSEPTAESEDVVEGTSPAPAAEVDEEIYFDPEAHRRSQGTSSPHAPAHTGQTGADQAEDTQLWGIDEFMLIAVQAGLLFTDLFCLLLPLPLLYVTSYRWGPVRKALDEPDVFMDHNSSLYATVLAQLSLILWDLLLAPLALLLFVTVYRSGPLWRMLSSTAALDREGFRLHLAVMVNFLCVLHDVLLLAPAVLLLPCFLVGYRAPIVYHMLLNHRKEMADFAEATAASSLPDGYYKIDIFPPGKFRARLWLQCLFCFLDIPFVVLGAIVLTTLWRAVELYASVRYLLSSHQITYYELASYRSNFRYENKIRKAILMQVLYLCRDVAFLLPFALIVATLYRLPALLGQLVAALLSGGASLVSDPVLDVESCHLEFPTRGGPQINFALRKRQATPAPGNDDHTGTSATGSAASARTHPRIVAWDTAAKVELHVVSDSIWEQAANLFGKFLVSLIRSYLPLKLEDGKGIGWAEYVHNAAAATLLTGQQAAIDVEGGANGVEAIQSLWLRLDFGTTKRTTILKKLRLMNQSTIISLQLEAYATVAAVEGSTAGHAAAQSATGNRQKVVVLRVHPRVADLVAILEAPTTSDTVAGLLPTASFFAPSTLEAPAIAAQRTDPNAPKARESNFVNSFHSVVQQSFVELAIDVAEFLMVLLTVLSPLRFGRMLVALLERESRLPGRICANTIRSVHHLDSHLLEYRKQIAGPLNSYFKDRLSHIMRDVHADTIALRNSSNAAERERALRRLRSLYESIDYSHSDRVDSLHRIEKYHLVSYQKLCKSSLKALSFFPGCEAVEKLVQERLGLHDEMMMLWHLRSAAGVQYRYLLLPDEATQAGSARSIGARAIAAPDNGKVVPQVDRAHYELVQLVLTEEQDRIAQRLKANEAQLAQLEAQLLGPSADTPPAAPARSLGKRFKQWYSQCGLLSRPITDSRKLILLMFLQAMNDVGFLLLLILLLVTLVRALPVLQELWDNGVYSPLQYTTRWVLIKHVKLLVQDLKYIGLFLAYTLVIIVTVGGLPKFAAALPYELTSYYVAAKCAEHHAKRIIENICSLLSLLTAFRTYRIACKASLYCAIIPGACIAESLSFLGAEAGMRFTVGLGVWIALLVGACVVSVRAVVGDDASSESHTADSRAALLSWCGAVFGVLFASALFVCGRTGYMRPDCHAVRSPQFTWDHLLALLTGPIESVQLSAVVLYFFWESARGKDAHQVASDNGKGVLTSLGADEYAAALMVWAPSPDSDGQYNNGLSSSSDGASSTGFRSSVMVASLLVIVWAMLIAAPIATSAAEGIRRREKVMAFKKSPFYEFLMVVLSRLLTVWIIATLLRSSSCVHVEDTSNSGANGYAVISTAQAVSCGDGDWWSSLASLSLLGYYMVTSSILHADDANLLRSAITIDQRGVKFAPFYALCVRAAQFFVCAACFGGFFAHSSLMPLVPILIMCVLIAALPALLALGKRAAATQAEGVSGQVCSVATVGVLRSAGFLCVAWTAIVCIVRTQGGKTGIFTSEATVYVGWGVVYAVALLVAWWENQRIRSAWQQRLRDSGLTQATEHLLTVIKSATVNEAANGAFLSAPASAVGEKDATRGLPLVSRPGGARALAISTYRNKIANVRSFKELAIMLMRIEQDILCERLTSEFLAQRKVWVRDLTEIVESEDFDDQVILGQGTPVNQVTLNQRAGFIIRDAGTSRNTSATRALTRHPTAAEFFIQELMQESEFSRNACERAVQATNASSITAAREWLYGHLDDPNLNDPLPAAAPHANADDLAVIDLESGNAETSETVVPTTATTTTAAAASFSPAVQRLLASISALERGITTSPATTNLSRQVFTIFMSRKLPKDVCWLIFSYSMSAQEIKRILLDKDWKVASEDHYYYRTAPQLRVKGSEYTKTTYYLGYASHFLRTRQEAIATATIATDNIPAGGGH